MMSKLIQMANCPHCGKEVIEVSRRSRGGVAYHEPTKDQKDTVPHTCWQAVMDEDTLFALNHGFCAGDYANSYYSLDLNKAWLKSEEEHDDSGHPAFKPAFILGFWSSYELREIPGQYRGQYIYIRRTWANRARLAGLHVRGRNRAQQQDEEADRQGS